MHIERINKLGKSQIEAASEVIICKDHAYFIAKFGDKQRFNPDPFIALVVYKNNNYSLVSAGKNLGYWKFSNLNNAVKSIKRINKTVKIKIFSDEEIASYVEHQRQEVAKFMNAVKRYISGDPDQLIKILKKRE